MENNKEIKEEIVEQPKEEGTEKKPLTLGETIDAFEKQMTDSLIKTYEDSGKRFKTLSLVSGLVGATSATIVAGNIVLGGHAVDIASNAGTTIAMASYSVGNALLAAHSYKKAKRVKESFNEDLSEINAIKSKLAILKEKLEYHRITGLMYGIAGTGFTTTFVSQLFRPESQIHTAEGFLIFSAVLAGLVGVGTVWVAKKSHSIIKGTKLDIAATEEDLKKAEEKNPEDVQKVTDAMTNAIIAQQEFAKGRTLK